MIENPWGSYYWSQAVPSEMGGVGCQMSINGVGCTECVDWSFHPCAIGCSILEVDIYCLESQGVQDSRWVFC
jgi:hypothetical protein